jgi:hypothetical protein
MKNFLIGSLKLLGGAVAFFTALTVVILIGAGASPDTNWSFGFLLFILSCALWGVAAKVQGGK